MTAAVLISLMLAQADGGALPFPVRFEGNVVLPNEVYEAVLAPPPDPTPDLELARVLAEQVHQFLLRGGYELAKVDAWVDDGRVVLHIDEGKLERLVFRGRITFQMLRFRLALDLPKNVFNRPLLEREVAERARALNIDPPRWELVDAYDPPHEGVQLQPSPALVVQGSPLIEPPHSHELHFTFGAREWNTGLGLALRTSWLNGFELGLNYQGASTFVRGDRWRVAVSGGIGLRRDVPRRNIYVTPTRAKAELLWLTPRLDRAGTTRGRVEVFGEYFLRQRRDFGLENYAALRTEVTAGTTTQWRSLLTASFGVGLQYFAFGPLTAAEGATPLGGLVLAVEADPWRLRFFGEAKVELTFFDGGARADRRHALRLWGRVSANLNRRDLPLFVQLRAAYQRVVPLGWHELWFNASGVWLSGDVLFPFEEVMGQHLPAVFGDVWLQKVFGVSVGFRYSLVRDLFKVGVFGKGLAYAEEQRELNTALLRAGVGAGPSVHVLVFDLFQLDVFLDFAVLSSGRFSAGVFVWLNKVF